MSASRVTESERLGGAERAAQPGGRRAGRTFRPGTGRALGIGLCLPFAAVVLALVVYPIITLTATALGRVS